MKKVLVIFLLMTISVFAMCACGNDDASSDGETATVVGAIIAIMVIGSGGVITKDIKAGTEEKTIHGLSYKVPESWKLDDTYENGDAFFETQKYDKKGDKESSDISLHVSYCGESRYYGNSLDEYTGRVEGYKDGKESEVEIAGVKGKVVSTTSTGSDADYKYLDYYFFDDKGSIFSFAFYTQEESHDIDGMKDFFETVDFEGYENSMPEKTVSNGKCLVSCDALMREIISAMNKNNIAEEYDCGQFTYQESSTKGGALCYSIYEDDSETGTVISFTRDNKGEESVKKYTDIPNRIAVAASLDDLTEYDSLTNLLIFGSVIQVTGDVNFDQGYSKYDSGVTDAKGYESEGYYENSFKLNGFDYEISALTKDDKGIFLTIR